MVLFSWISLAFGAAIFGCLAYGVFKERRIFIIPYLIFQSISVVLTTLFILVFIAESLISTRMLREISHDLFGIRRNISDDELILDMWSYPESRREQSFLANRSFIDAEYNSKHKHIERDNQEFGNWSLLMDFCICRSLSKSQLLAVFIPVSLLLSLLLQIYFLDIIYRFRNFLKDRENSFTFNMDSIFQSENSVYASSVEELGIVINPVKMD